MKWRIFELFFCLTWIPFLESDLIKDTNADIPPGTVITNEFCGYERFLARCNPREVILVRNASFGRMRAGKCVTGDYSHAIGCSSDVTSHVSNMCTGRQNCSFLVAMMDSVAQPCAKDFKSYLEASHVCHKAYFVEKNCGDNSVVLTKTDWSGYLAFYWRHLLLNPPLEFGSICTWKFTVEDGRRIEMSWIKTFQDIPPVKPTPLPRQRNLSQISHSYFKPNLRCPVKMWVSESSDNEVSVSACQDLSNRQRTFYTSLGNKMLLKIQMELSAKDEVMSFYVSRPNEVLPWQNKLLHFKVVGCPKVEQSGDHTTWQYGDSAAVVCASSGKTWYLSCRDGKWIGFVGNCSKADHKKLVSAEASNMGPSELSNGAVMAVLVGVVTGFAIGMLLLFAIVFTKRSYRRGRTQERGHKKLDMISHAHGNNYFTMTNTPSNSIRLRDSFAFKEREDCLQTINDVKENNNNNNNNNGRLIHHKTPSDILAPLPKTATPSPLFQYSQTAYSVSPASEPTKRRSGSYCIHRQYPNLPDFLSTCNSPECIECCLCSNADNFLISVSSHGEDFHNFANAMENLCNHNGDLESQSFLPCSKKDMAEEAHCSPSLFVPLEKVRLLSHPKHGCFGRNCQLSICSRPSPSHRSSYETCDCSSAASPRVKQITSSGHNSQCILLQDAEDIKGQENSGNKSKEEAKGDSEEVSCLKTSLVDG